MNTDLTPADSSIAAKLPLLRLTLSEAVVLLRRGDLKAENYAAALLQRCYDGASLNAFIHIDASALLQRARAADLAHAAGRIGGTLHGVPLALKDNIPSESLPTTGGTAALSGERSRSSAPVVERLYAQGALLLGKNGMHELAMGWTSDNPHFGRVGNPHAPHRLAGGSSGGSAAAVAALMVPAAIGSDTNGSIRIPAALCGVAGFRPSVGRYPTEGLMPLSHTLDTVGPIARCVRDLALLDAVMAGQPAGTPVRDLVGVRIALSPRYYLSQLEPPVERVFEAARRRLVAAGAVLVEADVPGLDPSIADIAPLLIRHESATALPGWLAAHTGGISIAQLIDSAGSDLAEGLRAGQRDIGSEEARRAYHAALQRRALLSETLQRYFAAQRADLLMHPVLRVAAPVAATHGSRISPAPAVPLADGSLMSARDAYARNVSPASVAALPSLVLPGGMSPDGLPIGIAFDAPHGSDARLLALGAALEGALRDEARTAFSLATDIQATP